tara:strand:+ start:197 stop:691 length:495 start_codon:yes stop_codon:yes gene_type:complete
MIFLNRFFILILFILSSLNAAANDNETIIEIDQPRFSEKGLNEKSFEIKAEKGLKVDNDLWLYEVEGKFKTDNGVWIYLYAKKGNYFQEEMLIELVNEISFYTEYDDEITAEQAIFDMKNDIITFNDKVQHKQDINIINCDKITITNNYENIKYTGNVLTRITR